MSECVGEIESVMCNQASAQAHKQKKKERTIVIFTWLTTPTRKQRTKSALSHLFVCDQTVNVIVRIVKAIV